MNTQYYGILADDISHEIHNIYTKMRNDRPKTKKQKMFFIRKKRRLENLLTKVNKASRIPLGA